MPLVSSRLLSIWTVGFLLGMRHATDADHVVAVSTIVARSKKLGAAWLLGAFWGIGHTVTIFLVGAAVILFKITIPSRVGLGMEFAVGVVLVLLGVLNMAGFRLGTFGIPAHAHPHEHDDPEHRHQMLEDAMIGHEHPHGASPGRTQDAAVRDERVGGDRAHVGAHADQPRPHGHAHGHVHEAELSWLKRMAGDAGWFQPARSLIVGLVHGLAGSAAVALLVLAAIEDPTTAVGYLLVFGAGTLAGMLILSTLMELSMLYLVRWWKTAERLMMLGTGLLSLLLGLYVVYRIGFVEGLFAAHPQWTPR